MPATDGWWVADVLSGYAGDHRPAHTYLSGDGTEVRLSRDDLYTWVTSRAGALVAQGVRPGDRVAVIAADPASFVPTFLALLWLGAVAVPLVPPPPVGRRDVWRTSVSELLVVASPTLLCAPASMVDSCPTDVRAVAIEDLAGAPPCVEPARLPPESPAYAQFTSGSTGRPRAVVATRASLAAGCAAVSLGLSLGESDVGVCWLPLHHDMGLVGFVCAPLRAGAPVVFLPTATFVRDPSSWMRTVSAYRGTITFGPTFAFGLAARRVRPAEVAGLDLSRLRVVGCGAEPIHRPTLERFAAAYAGAGFPREAFTPSYGLAEATLAVTFGQGVRDDDGIVDCGHPVPGLEVAVMDQAGMPCPDGEVGEVWVRGPAVAAGYLDESDPETFRPDGWLRTGDLGYLRDASLHVTGRSKDVLIVRGANIDPHRLEWAAAAVPGVRESGVVAFTRPGAETEEVVVVVECAPNTPDGIEDRVRSAVHPVGLTVADVVRVRPGTLPKTSSGKPRRQETRRRYLAGELVAS